MKYFTFIWLAAFILTTQQASAFPYHDNSGARCLDCHVSLPFDGVTLSFYEDIENVCSQCHKITSHSGEAGKGEGSHPVGVIPKFAVPRDMLLDIKGQMSCITCHVYHEGTKSVDDMNPFYLRRPPGVKFCLACHKKF